MSILTTETIKKGQFVSYYKHQEDKFATYDHIVSGLVIDVQKVAVLTARVTILHITDIGFYYEEYFMLDPKSALVLKITELTEFENDSDALQAFLNLNKIYQSLKLLFN